MTTIFWAGDSTVKQNSIATYPQTGIGQVFDRYVKRYQVQIQILNDLEKTIRAEGNTVTKEYVKGRKNVYTHPAIGEYNKTSTAANQTVQTLMKIVTTMRDDDDTGGEGGGGDELMAFLRGRRT